MENLALAFPLVLLLLLSTAAAADEASSLIDFKKSSIEIDPKNSLSNWVGDDFCSWAGIKCYESNDSVQGIDLSNMGLVGRLRIEKLMALPLLQDINLQGNVFNGNLNYSSTTSSPCRFVNVDLSFNNFSEKISSPFLTSCDRLLFLNLSGNSITAGVFPFGLSIRVLDVSNNKISDVGLLNYSLSRCQGLTHLNLGNNKIEGRLMSLPASCARLAVVDLSVNSIYGDIPANFISSPPASLNLLNLSHNNLAGEFSGFNFGGCGKITILDLSYNNLEASGLPASLGSCRQLLQLSLSGNNFTNQIPKFWRNFTSLKYLDLSANNFSGEIPVELAQTCDSLIQLNLSSNHLTGGLPSSFSSCSNLEILDLSSNTLTGNFVQLVVANLPSLKKLRIGFNNISGSLPLPALTGCKLLEEIDLSSNEFAGGMSAEFCRSLPSLQKLNLADNQITGSIPPELSNCTSLQSIYLSFNQLEGEIPLQLWSLPELVNIVMWANRLSGEIPGDLCARNPNLETLVLNLNSLTGPIPPSLGSCSKLIWISLAGNQLVGSIPRDVGNLQDLAILQLGNNFLSGNIPPELGNCQNLIWLDLNSNEFAGPIPSSLAAQSQLITAGIVSGRQFAFLRNNEAGNAASICPGVGTLFEFSGIRPERLQGLPLVTSCPSTRVYKGTTVYLYKTNGSMMYLDLSYNHLTGEIPSSLGEMNYLVVLNLGHNFLAGNIPTTFGGLKIIGLLDLSHNNLTGLIPASLGASTLLNDLDVSSNNLSGQIPASGQLTTFPPSRYAGNPLLCGIPLDPCPKPPPTQTPSRRKRPLSTSGFSLLIGVALSFLILLSLALALFKLKNSRRKPNELLGLQTSGSNSSSSNSNSGGTSKKLSTAEIANLSISISAFEKHLRKLTFAHLLEATGNFSADSLIGSGGFGEVYQARLKDGAIVAVKKLVRVTGQGDREFTAEMETIGKIKHRNLVPLLGYCKVGEERLLVYEYMRFGSLDVVLHEAKNKCLNLDWATRKKIAIGSARGLAFLHHSCIPHIIHRDMKSSNVLLDENLEARVSDFGMARLMNAVDTHLSVSTLAGTPGYVPPEYYQSFRCTTKGDVYSYGVVLLELLSGKKPIDTMDFGDNNLVGWAKQMVKEEKSGEIFDKELVKKSEMDELQKYLKIAFQCLEDRPLRRPTMIQVMAMFKELQMDGCDGGSDVIDGLSVRRSVIEEL